MEADGEKKEANRVAEEAVGVQVASEADTGLPTEGEYSTLVFFR